MTENYSLHLNLKLQRIDSLEISKDMQLKILNELTDCGRQKNIKYKKIVHGENILSIPIT